MEMSQRMERFFQIFELGNVFENFDQNVSKKYQKITFLAFFDTFWSKFSKLLSKLKIKQNKTKQKTKQNISSEVS